MSDVRRVRFARATANLETSAAFYRDVLGLPELARFTDHAGYDGVVFGAPDDTVQIELTFAHGAPIPPRPHAETLIVLYLDEDEYANAVARIRSAGIPTVTSENPYWDRHGVTIEDPDRQRVVICRSGAWGRR